MTNQFPASDFDKWAEEYDLSVLNNNFFPFFKYEELIAKMVELTQPRVGLKVLDLGCGTGNLSLPLKQTGCEVWGADFSREMLKKAKTKVPGAHFIHYDMRNPLPFELVGPFDCIVSSFAFHHFKFVEKLAIIEKDLPLLAKNGSVLIGDIAFASSNMKEQVKTDLDDRWEDEFYWEVAADLPALNGLGMNADYLPITPFSGIFYLTNLAKT